MILRDPRLKLRRYKAGPVPRTASEVFPDAIAAALKKPGDGVIVDDPRGVAVALGRKLGKLSREPVSPQQPLPAPAKPPKPPGEAELIAILREGRRLGPRRRDGGGPGGLRASASAAARVAAEQLLAAAGVVEGSLRGTGRARPQAEPAQGLDVSTASTARWRCAR